MYANIVSKEVTYPQFLSGAAIKILKGLLCKDPRRRLGAKNGVLEIKESEFCAGIDWEMLLKKKIQNVPIKP